jgi:hypothetical protein
MPALASALLMVVLQIPISFLISLRLKPDS